MATVNNATGVYATLGYNFSDPNNYVSNLSANAVAHLNAMPAFIESWQAEDIANNDIGGYFQNPVAGYVNTIITVSQQMKLRANAGNITSVETAANTLYLDAQNFLAHTNRISGVTPYTGDNTVPYYNNAMNLGKTALYITNQTDNITNTAPIMGSFTSILVGPQIYDAANTMSSDYIILDAGVTANNLSNSQITQILSDIANTDTLLVTRENGDVTYFTNLVNFVNNYNAVKQFSNMGETQNYLLNNFIGTDKLKARIN
jgi:predicted phage tail protein